jgi:hypothetical protein
MIKVYYKYNSLRNRDFHVLSEQILEQLNKHPGNIQVYPMGCLEIENFGNIELFDCELLVEYDGTYKGISLSDYHSDISKFFAAGVYDSKPKRNEHDTLITPQGMSPLQLWSETYVRSNIRCKIVGGIYTPTMPDINFDKFRDYRKSVDLIDKFVFKGSVETLPRKVVPYLKKSEYYSGTDTYGMEEYLTVVAQHKVGLCIPGAGELCHRDIEYMAMGVPMLKFEYIANLTPKLIPNYHYISIPRIDSHPFEGERSGEQEYADLYIKRFLEVKDDKEFLKHISNNAMAYYDTYLRPEARVRHIFNLWELPFYE